MHSEVASVPRHSPVCSTCFPGSNNPAVSSVKSALLGCGSAALSQEVHGEKCLDAQQLPSSHHADGDGGGAVNGFQLLVRSDAWQNHISKLSRPRSERHHIKSLSDVR